MPINRETAKVNFGNNAIPGARLIQAIAHLQNSVEPISDAIGEELTPTELRELLSSQIRMLNVLQSQLLTDGYKNSSEDWDVAREMQEMGLKTAAEMRKCAALLHDMQVPKRTTFIKQQQNNLCVEQAYELEFGATGETAISYSEVETLGEGNGTENQRG